MPAEAGAAVTAYVGLGSNLADPLAQLRRALRGLAALPASRLVRCSGFYSNPPMGPPDQPHYVNAVAELQTRLAPQALLAGLQAIENAQGRVRTGERWGPRTLDLDLLLYGDLTLASPTLTVPHPGLAERPFVVLPLLELAPALRLPDGRPLEQLSRSLDLSALHRLDDVA